MKHVRNFESFRNNKGLEPVNEEFVLGLLKGALSKVMAAFGNTFKDMANDFKNAFKSDDPNSIKGIIMTNFNQAVDGAQKGLNDKIVDEGGVTDMMNKMIDSLVGLATGIDKDIDTAVGKDKSAGAKAVAKAIILGSKEAAWSGIVGLLDPTKGKSGLKTTYKYSKMNYDLSLAKISDLKAKKAAASKFLDNMQKDIQSQLDKEFSEEEIEKLYKDSMDKAKQGGGEGTIVLDWGDVEVEIELPKEGGTTRYKITKSNSKKLVVPKGKSIFCDISGEVKKGDKVKFEKLSISNSGPLKIDGKDFYETGNLEKITLDGKEVASYKFEGEKAEGQEDLVTTLKDIKTKNADAIPKLNDIAKLYADPVTNKAKIEAIEKGLES